MRESLKAARLAKGYSVVDVAKLAKITPSVYYKWEAGSRVPLLENARQLSVILGKTVDELFFNHELDKTPNKRKKSGGQ